MQFRLQQSYHILFLIAEKPLLVVEKNTSNIIHRYVASAIYASLYASIYHWILLWVLERFYFFIFEAVNLTFQEKPPLKNLSHNCPLIFNTNKLAIWLVYKANNWCFLDLSNEGLPFTSRKSMFMHKNCAILGCKKSTKRHCN